jgi:S-adenosylmethionine hydrolase
VAVVDPDVGTGRRALAVAARSMIFLAPDNGILTFLPSDEIEEIRSIENKMFLRNPVSRTFHGRDVFAPVAAALAAGTALAEVGPAAADLRRLPLPEPSKTPEGLAGTILAFDRFGNAITSLRAEHVDLSCTRVRIGGVIFPLRETYAGVAPGEALAYPGSSGRLEIGVRNGNARLVLGLSAGQKVYATQGK